ncbi:MAG TPA: alpha/beta hydrolase [Stellaceae bacterium]|nr:alpha/beta hydrolase [Stellaceae bacterium]
MNDAKMERLPARGWELEVVRCGSGKPLLLLHGFQTVDPRARFVELLGRRRSIVAPSHPGFGLSPRPDGFETIYDLTRLYLDVLDALPDEKITVMGFSFGGWLAAELAVMGSPRIDRLILVDALGIKVSGRETPDILDVFNTAPAEVERRSWHDPARWAPDYNAMADEAIVRRARNWDALCLYGWHPYMHNPRLKDWLPRIAVPTLVVWGSSDGIVAPSYGKAMCDLIPGARFALIDEAGHRPEIERPDAFVDAVTAFLEG